MAVAEGFEPSLATRSEGQKRLYLRTVITGDHRSYLYLRANCGQFVGTRRVAQRVASRLVHTRSGAPGSYRMTTARSRRSDSHQGPSIAV